MIFNFFDKMRQNADSELFYYFVEMLANLLLHETACIHTAIV